mgnify:CR=1 FL=1
MIFIVDQFTEFEQGSLAQVVKTLYTGQVGAYDLEILKPDRCYSHPTLL